MAIKTITTLKTDVNSNITTNGARGITGAIHNALLQDILDSCVNRVSDVSILGLFDFSSSQTYLEGQATIYDDGGSEKIYRANTDNGPSAFNPVEWDEIGSADTNLGNTNQVLTGDRTVTGAYSLDINVTGSAQSRFVKSGDGLILQSTNTRIQKGSNVIRLEAGSITVAAAGSGLGIAYDNRTIDEANVVWGTDLNHMPSMGEIVTHIGGQDVNALVTTPTIAEDGKAIIWDNTAGEYAFGIVGDLTNDAVGGNLALTGGSATGTGAIAIGTSSTAAGTNSVAIGTSSSTTVGVNNTQVAVGNNASVTSGRGIAIGWNSTSAGGVAIGATTNAQTGTAIGGGTSTGSGVAIGAGSSAISGSLAIFGDAVGSGVVLGSSTINASGLRNVVVGDQSSTAASTSDSVVLGGLTQATGSNAIAIGRTTRANTGSISLGFGAGNSTGTIGTKHISIGSESNSGTANIGQNSIGIGVLVESVATNSVAIGTSVVNSLANSFAFGTSATPSLVFAETATSYLNGTGAVVVGGTTETNSSVSIDMQSTTRVPKLPVLTTTERDALTATDGMIIMNSTTATIQGYFGLVWNNL